MFGILNLLKPPHVTSRDVVNQVQRLVKPAKAGHAGTLDPLAFGVLVVGVGPATRLVEYVQRMPKRYRGTFLLGRSSDTDDVEGSVAELSDASIPTREQIEAALPALTGRIMQRPPAFSALKVKGKRAYDLARRGESFELEARPVIVYRLALRDYDYPRLELDVECGGGTYIRAIGRDLAASLGTAAVMSDLCRTAIGGFRLEDAVSPDALTRENLGRHLLPAARAVEGLPTVQLTAEECERIRRGMAIQAGGRTSAEESTESTADEFAALTPSGELAAILVPRATDQLRPSRMFLPAATSPPSH
ncbi:MAG: tRNA pseudouridine(55) synthase TruB [Pirellulaceae bacterium]